MIILYFLPIFFLFCVLLTVLFLHLVFLIKKLLWMVRDYLNFFAPPHPMHIQIANNHKPKHIFPFPLISEMWFLSYTKFSYIHSSVLNLIFSSFTLILSHYHIVLIPMAFNILFYYFLKIVLAFLSHVESASRVSWKFINFWFHSLYVD